ncbi:Serum amyloid A protein [Acipenser ruthenus]|uniref:Serum amyloid A protein n=1 Tax=Acipenser ruthenus TaxID=7906 RepID=A0A444V0P9_ACIRT|nr:Serum amyloid A protein [Acipenser ruthenus]
MKLYLCALVLCLVLGAQAQWYKYPDQAVGDKYFQTRRNSKAAQRGPGGRWTAEVISDGDEAWQRFRGSGQEDAAADQAANHRGCNGENPNDYRPAGLPPKY